MSPHEFGEIVISVRGHITLYNDKLLSQYLYNNSTTSIHEMPPPQTRACLNECVYMCVRRRRRTDRAIFYIPLSLDSTEVVVRASVVRIAHTNRVKSVIWFYNLCAKIITYLL